MRTSVAILVSSLAVALHTLPGQTELVFPTWYVEAEGENTHSLPPFGAPTVQQVNDEAAGMQFVARSMTFRRDGPLGGGNGPTTVEVEVLMGGGDFAGFWFNLAQNWRGSPATVFTRKNLQLPDWTSAAACSLVAPFDAPLPFDVPYAHDGVNALLWEMRFYSGSPAGVADLATSPGFGAGNEIWAQTRRLGTGCATNTSGTSPLGMQTEARIFLDNGGNGTLSLGTCAAPSFASSFVLLGDSDPALAVPGFCTQLRSNAAVVVPIGSSGAAGRVFVQTGLGPWNPAYSGLRLFAQALALDSSQPGLPVAGGYGVRLTLPPSAQKPLAVKTVASFGTSARLHHYGLVFRLGT